MQRCVTGEEPVRRALRKMQIKAVLTYQIGLVCFQDHSGGRSQGSHTVAMVVTSANSDLGNFPALPMHTL